jgi:nitrous oxide reductase accessory protein NosL
MFRIVNGLRLAALLLVIGLAACKPDSGPVEIKYGREACEMCGMIISDPHYATEARGGPDNKLVKFDDIGDAMNWLEKKGWGLAATKELWVMNSLDGTTWLDARQAFFKHGHSPMDYGFAALPTQTEDAVSFDEMRAQTLKRGMTSRCEPDQEPKDVSAGEHK